MGFNRHIPTAIRYGPKRLNGKGLIDLEIQQFTQHVERLVGYLRKEDEVGNLLHIQLETHQILIGSSKLFLNLDPDVYCYGEPS